jgi:hypothetical protein
MQVPARKESISDVERLLQIARYSEQSSFGRFTLQLVQPRLIMSLLTFPLEIPVGHGTTAAQPSERSMVSTIIAKRVLQIMPGWIIANMAYMGQRWPIAREGHSGPYMSWMSVTQFPFSSTSIPPI